MPFAKEAEMQRTCWKCEGSVSMHMPQCPYCSAFLQDPPVASGGFSSCHISFPEGSTKGESEDLFAVSSEDWEAVLSDQNTFQKSTEQSEANWNWLQHWPLVALFLGAGFLAFALIILLFATDAGLTLTWPKNRAYLYGIIGAVFAYRGYFKLSE
ncbi:phage holin family protein [Chlamydia crocodili]|uniref:Phage holin family protein n=1 Tax=Chlamydia crocodili TaxID=2766982 RepID=A0ABX8CEL8_9CHLA|nr:phage holin family protein [Chlamydia crocodili]QVE49455.1 phage holin family protein [Chlamydia crocodili]